MGGKGGGGGGGGGDSTTTIRYAPYVEEHHNTFLDLVQTSVNTALTAGSPYTTYTAPEVEDAFFSAGYTIASFPSLYDMFGKFMAGLDIEVLWEQTFQDTVNNPQVGNLVTAEAVLLDDDIELNLLPRFQTGMRDMNAVMTSSYIIGKAIIEDARTKALAKFDAELRYKLIPIAQERYAAHLNWNNGVIKMYAELMKFYYSAKHDVDEQVFSMAARTALWPFTVLEYERAALGALQGATNTNKDVAGGSTAQNVIGGAMGGAAAGAMIGMSTGAAYGGVYGAAIGGVLGGIAGLFG
jgi:hypothetical protein